MKKTKLTLLGATLLILIGSCRKAEVVEPPKFLNVSFFAGNGAPKFADGIATAASFNGPSGMAVDAAGNIYVADTHNHRIRKITPNGEVTTIAGTGDVGYVDGPAATAQFNWPYGITIDASGNLYVTDENNVIRKITPGGTVSTFAGSGNDGYADGPAATAKFSYPRAIAIDASNNLYVADQFNNRVRKITPTGIVSTYAGTGQSGRADGPVATATIEEPIGIAVDASGNVYVTVSNSGYAPAIRKITSSGIVSTFAGGNYAGFQNGPGGLARFSDNPLSIGLDATGNMYLVDNGNQCIRKITPDGFVSTFAGIIGVPGIETGKVETAKFYYPMSVVVDGAGNVFVSDGSQTIRKISMDVDSSKIIVRNWNKPKSW